MVSARGELIMNKKIGTIALLGVLSVIGLTACGKTEQDDKTIKVAATAVPHAEILEAAKPLLEEKGYKLEVTVFNDYVQPNKVVETGDFDANYFQHIPYLEKFNEEQKTHLVNAGGVHYELLGLYPGKEGDIGSIPDKATIAIPNDTTNEARALLMLQENGLIRLDEGAGITATVNDIVENPQNIEFVELESAQIPRTLKEVSYGVLNGNYAMEAGLNAREDALLLESEQSGEAQKYVNIIAVKEGNENLDKIKVLMEVLTSDDIKAFIDEKYKGSAVPFQ